MFIFFNPNPDGLFTNDCTVRAICKALDQNWDKTYMDICTEGGLLHMMPSTNAVWNSYLSKKGFKRYIIPYTRPICYTIKQFCEDHKVGKYILATDDHVVTVINGDYYDTGDSGDEVPIYYWKESQ